MNKAYISSTLLMLSILFFPLLAALVFRSKANKLREQKPVLFIVSILLILFSPIIIIMIQISWSHLPIIPTFLYVLVTFMALIIVFFILKDQYTQMEQMTSKNKELNKISSIYTTGLILTLVFHLFEGESVIKVYLATVLILIYWIYAIFTIIIVAKKIKITQGATRD